jgi:hypothetical protein
LVHLQVRIVLEGADKFNNLIGSIHYPDKDAAIDLSLELVKQVSYLEIENMRSFYLGVVLTGLATLRMLGSFLFYA